MRYVAAAILFVAVSAYLAAITLGKFGQPRRLAATDLGVILAAAALIGSLVRPEFLNRLTHVKVGSVEFELQQLQQGQRKQQNELDDVRFVLTLLLQKNELSHLRNLEIGNTKDYRGNHDMRTELRKLRTLGLIRTVGERHIGEFANGTKFDLASIVKLTERGQQYLDRLGEYDSD